MTIIITDFNWSIAEPDYFFEHKVDLEGLVKQNVSHFTEI